MAALIRKISFSRINNIYRLTPTVNACKSISTGTVNIGRSPVLRNDVTTCHDVVSSHDVITVRRYQTSRDRLSQRTEEEPLEKERTNVEQEDDGHAAEMSEEEIKLCVLNSALEFVPEHGWTTQAISAGASAEGLPGVAHGMFPRGGVELVEFFYKDCNGRLADQLVEEAARRTADGGKLAVTKFVRDAIEQRLRMIHPYKDTWSEAMGLQVLPQNAPTSLKNLLNLCDDIWFYAGDQSTDMNWYTKRLSLAYVYKATEIYMLQDHSDDHQETWNFLENRLGDVKTIGQTLSQGKTIVGSAFELLKAASTVGMNMTGLNRHDRRGV